MGGCWCQKVSLIWGVVELEGGAGVRSLVRSGVWLDWKVGAVAELVCSWVGGRGLVSELWLDLGLCWFGGGVGCRSLVRSRLVLLKREGGGVQRIVIRRAYLH